MVHDRYQDYDAKVFAHLVRDCVDTAETHPNAHWPVQIRQAMQALVHQATQPVTKDWPRSPRISPTR